jgi:hypothetical protein
MLPEGFVDATNTELARREQGESPLVIARREGASEPVPTSDGKFYLFRQTTPTELETIRSGGESGTYWTTEPQYYLPKEGEITLVSTSDLKGNVQELGDTNHFQERVTRTDKDIVDVIDRYGYSVPTPTPEIAPQIAPIVQEPVAVPKVPWEMTQAEWDAVQNPLDIKPLKAGDRIVYHVLLKKGAGMTGEETIASALKNGIRRENTNTGIWVSLDKPVNDFGDMFVIELPESDLHIMNQQEAMVERRDILPSDVRAYYPSFRANPNSAYTRLDTSKFENGDTREDWVQVAQQNATISPPVAETATTPIP